MKFSMQTTTTNISIFVLFYKISCVGQISMVKSKKEHQYITNYIFAYTSEWMIRIGKKNITVLRISYGSG